MDFPKNVTPKDPQSALQKRVIDLEEAVKKLEAAMDTVRKHIRV